MTKTLLTCLGVVAVTALSGCSTVKNLQETRNHFFRIVPQIFLVAAL